VVEQSNVVTGERHSSLEEVNCLSAVQETILGSDSVTQWTATLSATTLLAVGEHKLVFQTMQEYDSASGSFVSES